MKKPICILIFILTLVICSNTFATVPPFSGGEITSPFGPRTGIGSDDHQGIDVGIPSGVPIVAPKNGMVNHGAGGGYIYWVDITFDDGTYIMFGDCSPETLNGPTGYVAEGTIIGYSGGDAYKGPLGESSGPHAHIEVRPYGEFSSAINPVPYLESLGMVFSGDATPTGGGGSFGGHDNISLPWGVEGMYQIGENLQEIMESVASAAGIGFAALQRMCLSLIIAICIIDLTLPMLLGGLRISLQYVISKVIKYGFLIFLLINWQRIINDFFLSFVTSVSTTFSNNPDVGNDVSQPQVILQKAIFMVTPALNKIASFGSLDFVTNLPTILPIYLMTFIVIGIFFVLACYIMFIYCEFYVVSALSVCTFPFSAWGFTKFIAEGGLGHLVSSTIKLTILSIMVAFCVVCIKDAQPGDIFKVTTPSTEVSGTGTVSGPADLVALATEKANKYGIPVTLFLAQIQTESSWNPNAVSSAGAQGLGQLMPDTAAWLGCSNSFDPEQNLEAAAKYMQYLHDMYGDWNYALAAYNGGPGQITKGEPLPGWAMDYINMVNGNLSGSYTVDNGISSEAMSRFILMCLALIGLAFLTFKIPKSVMQHLGGKYEIST